MRWNADSVEDGLIWLYGPVLSPSTSRASLRRPVAALVWSTVCLDWGVFLTLRPSTKHSQPVSDSIPPTEGLASGCLRMG